MPTGEMSAEPYAAATEKCKIQQTRGERMHWIADTYTLKFCWLVVLWILGIHLFIPKFVCNSKQNIFYISCPSLKIFLNWL